MMEEIKQQEVEEDSSYEFCLWACSPDLNLKLLLKNSDGSQLDRNSFFNLLEVNSSVLKSV